MLEQLKQQALIHHWQPFKMIKTDKLFGDSQQVGKARMEHFQGKIKKNKIMSRNRSAFILEIDIWGEKVQQV